MHTAGAWPQVSRGTHEAGGSGAKKKLATTLQLFRDLGQSTAHLVSNRHQDEEEDPEYLKVPHAPWPPCHAWRSSGAVCHVEAGPPPGAAARQGREQHALGVAQVRDYMTALEGHLAEAHKQAQRLLKRQAELGSALAEFGAAMAGVGAFDSAPLDQAFQGLSARSAAVATLCQVLARVRLRGSLPWPPAAPPCIPVAAPAGGGGPAAGLSTASWLRRSRRRSWPSPLRRP